MKQTLFSLLAGLVSLSLAGCTLSLLSTPTPFPTFPSLPSPTPLAAAPTSSEPTITKKPTAEALPATITVAPSPTETLAATLVPPEHGPSLEFSPLFPAEWHNEWTGHVTLADGSTLNIPIIIGVAADAYDNPAGSIHGVWMKQIGADSMVDAFLRAAHYRYSVIMGNTGVTYEQYLELLKQPTGGEISLGILDNDGKTMRLALIDPRQGFSMLMTDKKKMPVYTIAERGVFFGVDGRGRLLMASNDAIDYPRTPKIVELGVDLQGTDFLAINLSDLLYFGAYDNKCLLDRVCNLMTIDPGAKLSFDWRQIMINNFKQQMNDKKIDPIFGLETP